jgi:hypothetical protein
MAQELGAAITVENGPGKGVFASLSLPLSQAAWDSQAESSQR